MSIAVLAIGEGPLAAQGDASSFARRPPPKRIIVATSDTVAHPEPR